MHKKRLLVYTESQATAHGCPLAVSLLMLWLVPIVPASAATVVMSNVVDARSFYQDLRAYGGGVSQSVDQVNDSALRGYGAFPSFGDRTIGQPVFEFTVDSALFGESDLTATFDFYLTQEGSDASGDDFSLYYGQGDGMVQYGDTGGTMIGDVDPEQSGWLSVDVSSAIQTAANEGWGFVRFTFDPNSLASSADELYLASSENEGLEPSITVVPEPVASGLLVGGVALCSVLCRLRRR